MSAPVQGALRRLARRLAIGLFLDVWPRWAAASLLLAGTVVLACRVFLPDAAAMLPWLWLAPLAAAVPVLVLCVLRAYRPAEVVALADWLGGGEGFLITHWERPDTSWIASPAIERAATFPLPRLRPWRTLAAVPPAAIFLAAAFLVPQRAAAGAANAALAEDIAADLAAAVETLKQQALVTPEEEERLADEIERIRRAAQERVDASAWEAADAFREKVSAGLAGKEDALEWAERSLERYTASATADADALAREAHANELAKALDTLARSGLLAAAPEDLQRLLKAGALPTDPAAMRQMAASLAKYLQETNGRFGQLAKLGKGFGRFDPREFPLDADAAGEEGSIPGRGRVTRGRADADLTWGKETAPLDRFKAHALPPGAARSPDDWAPLVELPGAPQTAPTTSRSAFSREYAATAGQGAWRRTLAPRHRSAVKKYFARQAP